MALSSWHRSGSKSVSRSTVKTPKAEEPLIDLSGSNGASDSELLALAAKPRTRKPKRDHGKNRDIRDVINVIPNFIRRLDDGWSPMLAARGAGFSWDTWGSYLKEQSPEVIEALNRYKLKQQSKNRSAFGIGHEI